MYTAEIERCLCGRFRISSHYTVLDFAQKSNMLLHGAGYISSATSYNTWSQVHSGCYD
jgi:hypothetical protein